MATRSPRSSTGHLDVAYEHVARLAELAGERHRLGGRVGHAVGDDGLVGGVVERGADVVAHAAVHGDVLADAGDVLDGADGVERDARASDDGAARLDDQLRGTEAEVAAAALYRGGDHVGVCGDRGRLAVPQVADCEAAAGAELAQIEAVQVERGDERQHRVDADGVGLELEYRRAEMHVDADQVEAGRRNGAAHGLLRVAGLDGEAELAVERAGRRVDVSMGIDAGREAQHDVLHDAAGAGHLVEHVQLAEVVDYDAADAVIEGHRELFRPLVVAVEVDVRGGYLGRLRDGQLAAGHDVESEPPLRSRAGPAPG